MNAPVAELARRFDPARITTRTHNTESLRDFRYSPSRNSPSVSAAKEYQRVADGKFLLPLLQIGIDAFAFRVVLPAIPDRTRKVHRGGETF